MFIYNLINSGMDIARIILTVLALLIVACCSIVFHEIAHGYVALWNGDVTARDRGRLTLNPVAHFDGLGLLMMFLVGFGWAKPVPVNPNNFKNRKLGMFTVSIAGIVVNLLLGGLCLLIVYLAYPSLVLALADANSSIVECLLYLVLYILQFGVQINFTLALFNLLPIYPLDGFNMLNSLLPQDNKYARFMVRYGYFVLLAIILIGNISSALNFKYLDVFGMYNDAIYEMLQKVIAKSILRYFGA